MDASAVGTDDADDLAQADVDAHAVDRPYAPKATVSPTARSTGAPGSGGPIRPPLRWP